jgi:uncharacterized protein
MPYKFLDIASTPSVKAAQAANGSADYWSGFFEGNRVFDRFGDGEIAFIQSCDSSDQYPGFPKAVSP